MKDLFEYILYVFLILVFFSISFYLGILHERHNVEDSMTGTIGLWLKDSSMNETKALERAYNYSTKGDWICINIRNMTIEKMIKTCHHEAGHEIFAEVCEDNIDKCLEITK